MPAHTTRHGAPSRPAGTAVGRADRATGAMVLRPDAATGRSVRRRARGSRRGSTGTHRRAGCRSGAPRCPDGRAGAVAIDGAVAVSGTGCVPVQPRRAGGHSEAAALDGLPGSVEDWLAHARHDRRTASQTGAGSWRQPVGTPAAVLTAGDRTGRRGGAVGARGPARRPGRGAACTGGASPGSPRRSAGDGDLGPGAPAAHRRPRSPGSSTGPTRVCDGPRRRPGAGPCTAHRPVLRRRPGGGAAAPAGPRR